MAEIQRDGIYVSGRGAGQERAQLVAITTHLLKFQRLAARKSFFTLTRAFFTSPHCGWTLEIDAPSLAAQFADCLRHVFMCADHQDCEACDEARALLDKHFPLKAEARDGND